MSLSLSRPSDQVRAVLRWLEVPANEGARNSYWSSLSSGQLSLKTLLIARVPFSHSATYSDSFQSDGLTAPAKRSGSFPYSQRYNLSPFKTLQATAAVCRSVSHVLLS